MLKVELDDITQDDCDRMAHRLAALVPQTSTYTPSLNFTKMLTIAERVSGGSLKDKAFLDVGCGGGGLVMQASLLGAKAVGIDLADGQADSLEIARNFLSSSGSSAVVREHDVTTMLPRDLEGEFDIVTSAGMMEHIPTASARTKAVRNMMSALKPGGTLLLLFGPNSRFPLDFYHYGFRYPAYHILPSWAKALYLRHIIKPKTHSGYRGALADENEHLVNGVSVNEVSSAIRSQFANADVAQGFPVLVRLAVSRSWLRNPVARLGLGFVARVLTALRAEPIILMAGRRPNIG